MSDNQKEALRLLGAYTAHQFKFWLLAGNAKASCRAHIMSALHGKRMPQSKSGVNALREAFLEIAQVQGSCAADQDDNFVKWAKSCK